MSRAKFELGYSIGQIKNLINQVYVDTMSRNNLWGYKAQVDAELYDNVDLSRNVYTETEVSDILSTIRCNILCAVDL